MSMPLKSGFFAVAMLFGTMVIFCGCQNRLSSSQDDWQALQRRAEQGSPAAMFELGGKYFYGEEVRQNYRQAIEWYRRAAAKGNVHAMYNLGGIYAYGRGVEINYAEAAKWYRRAAERGDVEAGAQLEWVECQLQKTWTR